MAVAAERESDLTCVRFAFCPEKGDTRGVGEFSAAFYVDIPNAPALVVLPLHVPAPSLCVVWLLFFLCFLPLLLSFP